jgi:hypothetical protein
MLWVYRHIRPIDSSKFLIAVFYLNVQIMSDCDDLTTSFRQVYAVGSLGVIKVHPSPMIESSLTPRSPLPENETQQIDYPSFVTRDELANNVFFIFLYYLPLFSNTHESCIHLLC